MGKRRHSAKTGDNKLYASRQRKFKVIPDPVEDLQTERDKSYLALEADDVSGRSLEEQPIAKQHVFDLEVSDDSSEGEYSSDGGVMEDVDRKCAMSESVGDDDDDSVSDNAIDGKTDELNEIDPRSWGKKKSAYYDADTRDLEIGQDEQDAFMEEAAAREVQSSRFGEMDQGDFVLPEETDDGGKNPALFPDNSKFQIGKGTVQRLPNQKRKYMRLQHPELIPISSHFSEILKRLLHSTKVILGAVFDNKETAKDIGASKEGQLFLLTNAMIEQNISLNTAMYLLVKVLSIEVSQDYEDINAHPVMRQLNLTNILMEEFVAKVAGKTEQLHEQMNSLVQAASLMHTLSSRKGIKSNPPPVKRGENDNQSGFNAVDQTQAFACSDGTDAPLSRRVILNDARFGMRQHEINRINKNQERSITNFIDVGDTSHDRKISRHLAATINAIDQRAATTSTKRNVVSYDDKEYFNKESESLAGVKLMEDEFEVRRLTRDSGSIRDDTHSDDEGSHELAFYKDMAEKATRRKRLKEEEHKVAPKFPKLEAAVTGERAISTMILKNRGLVAHKAKINRNPRVKKRVQYRKALIRRKGAVRVIRTDEGHKYSGEETGIKSRISRSRKLAL